jgi:hypothetical protein
MTEQAISPLRRRSRGEWFVCDPAERPKLAGLPAKKLTSRECAFPSSAYNRASTTPARRVLVLDGTRASPRLSRCVNPVPQ